MDVGGELTQAVEQLYRAFSSYPRPKWFAGCACCWSSDEPLEGTYARGTVRVWAPGGDRPLRELTPEDLRELAENVPHLGGDVGVLRHYLPRIFDIAFTVGFDWPDLEPLVARLSYDARLGGSPWWTWPDDERTAINRFLAAAWTERLAEPAENGRPMPSADELLCSVGLVVDDIRPFLTKWTQFDEARSAEHLAAFLTWNSDLVVGRLSNAFWGPDSERVALNIRRVVQWAHSTETIMAVMDASSDELAPNALEALETCASLLTGANAFGDTVLEAAVEAGDHAHVRQLLDQGVDPNERDQVTATPLWILAMARGRHRVVAEFVRAGANLDVPDKKGRTLLQRLVSQGPEVDGPRRLIELGASVHVQDRYGWTPLHCASAYGYAAIAEILLTAGAKTGVVTRDGLTALDFATSNGHADVVRILSSRGGQRSTRSRRSGSGR
jgi:hypothetical protein